MITYKGINWCASIIPTHYLFLKCDPSTKFYKSMSSSWHKEPRDISNPIIVKTNSTICKLRATFSWLDDKGAKPSGHTSLAYNWKDHKTIS